MLLFNNDYTNLSSCQQCAKIPFSPCPEPPISCHFGSSHLSRCEWHLVVLICFSLLISDIEYFLFIGHFYVFGKISVRFFGHFQIMLLLSAFEFANFSCILDIKSLHFLFFEKHEFLGIRRFFCYHYHQIGMKKKLKILLLGE